MALRAHPIAAAASRRNSHLSFFSCCTTSTQPAPRSPTSTSQPTRASDLLRACLSITQREIERVICTTGGRPLWVTGDHREVPIARFLVLPRPALLFQLSTIRHRGSGERGHFMSARALFGIYRPVSQTCAVAQSRLGSPRQISSHGLTYARPNEIRLCRQRIYSRRAYLQLARPR